MKLQKLNCPNCGQQFHIDNEKREYTVNKNISINKI